MIKILDLKLVMLLEYQNIKSFLQKVMFRIGWKRIANHKSKVFRVEK